jgi:basic amino acid/polyamine antiporter, APA family
MALDNKSAADPATSKELVPGLKLFDATAIIVGNMIGSGIFIVSAEMARDLQSVAMVLTAWVVTALMTVIGALCYGELAASMPRAGGQYVFLREAYGPMFGFLYGWTLFLVIQTGTIAAVAVAFAKFLGVFVPSVSASHEVLSLPLGRTLSSQQLVAITIIAILTWVNCRSLKEGKTVQNLFTSAKVLGLLALVALGFALPAKQAAVQANFGGGHPLDLNLTMLSLMGAALVGSLFSADAWNNVTFTGSEVINPGRNLPLSLILGTAAVSAIYLAANVVYLRILPLSNIASAPEDRVATLAMQDLIGPWGAIFITVCILVSTFGCTNGLILAGARVFYAMAKDKLFFRSVASVSPRTHTPIISLIIQGVWAAFLTLSGTYSNLLDYVIFANLLFYVLTAGALFVLRKKRADLDRPYKAFGYPLLPALYMVLAVLIMVDLLWIRPKFTWPGLIIVLTGVPVYYFWHSRSRQETEASDS